MTTRIEAGCRAIAVAALLVWSTAGLIAQAPPPARSDSGAGTGAGTDAAGVAVG